MTGAMTHILRASLKARVYRDIEIEANSSLYALAEAITHAFKFDFDHAFGFFSRLTGERVRVTCSILAFQHSLDQEPIGGMLRQLGEGPA